MSLSAVADALGPYLLVAVLAALWAMTEVIQAFRSDIRRALRSGWSGLLMGIHGALALLVFALARVAFPSANPYLLALVAGLGGLALIRTRINLLQPLNPAIGEAVSLSLADLYGRLQNFCWEQINQGLLAGRTRLLERATRLPVERLEREVRLFAHASALHPPEQVEAYLEKLRSLSDEARALALASFLLREGGYDFFQERLRAMEK
ncbi:MAG: hypothetical protein N3B68_11355 [Anaerolineae bacterium]|nr:hypothetical protein [Anaerolineae bacterium]